MFPQFGLAMALVFVLAVLGTAAAPALMIDLLQPAYRQTIYATQKLDDIVFRLRWPTGLHRQARRVTARLLAGPGTEVRTISSAGPASELRLEAATLPLGKYTLEVEAFGEGDRQLGKARVTLNKVAPSPGSEVRIDEHGNILVNGKPTILIGWYGEVPLTDPRPDVICLQNVQTPMVVNYPNKESVSKLFRERGIYSVVTLEPGRLLYSFDLWKKPGNPVPSEHTRLSAPSQECRGYLQKMVDLLRDEPGLLAWYIADEPEINDTRPDYLQAFYQALRELDPYHPVIVTNDTIEGIEKIGFRCSDILSPDPYSPKPDYVPSFLRKARSVQGRGQTLMLTPFHTCGHTHFSFDYGTNPPYSYRVMRGQYLAGIAYGVRGFTGYASDFFLPEPRLRYGLPRLWREVRFLEAAMASPAPTEPLRIEPADQVVGWLRRCGNDRYLIVMNSGPTRKFAIRHPALETGQLPVVSEQRAVSVRDGSFVDEVPSGEAHLYSTDRRGTDLPTVEAVEAEIAAAEESSQKKGNLLHASRGVKARASRGAFAPWFSQYFYYAINGITEDNGWHVTHADLPQWLELALPEPKLIGRVILHTPNLRDYDLEFRGTGGSLHRAEVRGNKETVAVHRLEKPLDTLKLRIVARAVRENSTPPRAMVREIEALAEPGEGPFTTVQQVPAQAGSAVELPREPAEGHCPPLWFDDFSRFLQKDRHYEGPEDAWVFNPRDFSAKSLGSRKGLHCTSTSTAGYSAMGRLFPYSPEHRFFQVRISGIEGEGYQWFTLIFGDPSGKRKARTAVHTLKPGLYTVDTHALNDAFRTGDMKQALLQIYLSKNIQYRLDWLDLNRVPRDGLVVTQPNGAPLPVRVKQGDELLFRLYLAQPASDALVELMHGPNYEPARINGEPYVQLLPLGREKDSRFWSARVKLGPGTDKFKLAGYPLLFRCVITGGSLRETLVTCDVNFE